MMKAPIRYARSLDAPPDDWRGLAFHESGHVVTAAVLGYPVVAAWLYVYHGCPEPAGRSITQPCRFGRFGTKDPAHVQIIELAGPVAALLAGSGSFVSLVRHYHHFTIPDTSLADVVRFVRDTWAAIEAVAALLLTERYVTGDRLCGAMLEALGMTAPIVFSALRSEIRWAPGSFINVVYWANAGWWIRT
jgi:hypothetical protein